MAATRDSRRSCQALPADTGDGWMPWKRVPRLCLDHRDGVGRDGQASKAAGLCPADGCSGGSSPPSSTGLVRALDFQSRVALPGRAGLNQRGNRVFRPSLWIGNQFLELRTGSGARHSPPTSYSCFSRASRGAPQLLHLPGLQRPSAIVPHLAHFQVAMTVPLLGPWPVPASRQGGRDVHPAPGGQAAGSSDLLSVGRVSPCRLLQRQRGEDTRGGGWKTHPP